MSWNKNQKTVKQIREDIKIHFAPITFSDLLKMKESKDIDSIFLKIESFLEQHVRGITSTQLRKLADLVSEKNDDSLIRITRPQFALMIAKQAKEDAKYIMLLVDELAKIVNSETIVGFHFFIETLIAFHRYYDVLNSIDLDKSKIIREVEKDLSSRQEGIQFRINDFLQEEKTQNIDKILNAIEHFLQKNSKGITSTQLRNIYNKFLEKADSLKSMKELKPMLAYTAAKRASKVSKNEKREPIKLIFLIIELLTKSKDKDQFLKLLQAIVASQKFEETVTKGDIDFGEIKRSTIQHFRPFTLVQVLEMNQQNSIYEGIQEKIKEYMEDYRKGLKSSQFHRLYEAIMFSDNLETDAQKLAHIKWQRPLFLYTAARQNNDDARRLILFLVKYIVDLKENQLDGFQNLISDMLAYHRYYDAISDSQ